MQITTDENIKEFLIDKIKKMYITFDDGNEIELINIESIDLDLDKIEMSYINFTSAVTNIELINYFEKKNNITHIHFNSNCYAVEKGIAEKKESCVFYDIPCFMHIRRLRIDMEDHGTMHVELEGSVK